MADIDIRVEGRVGCITLNRPDALNALTYSMCLALDQALKDWRDASSISLVLIGAIGSRAFCSGGDIAQLYTEGRAGNFDYGRKFWRDEYRMNARIAEYPKPIVSLMQGFIMGGGVGVGCHGSHRIVGESSQIAMPECGIGLIPDVGGSFLLAHAPGKLGAYLGTTGARMGPADAIFAHFADTFVPEADWPILTSALIETGTPEVITTFARSAPQGRLADLMPSIDAHFAGGTFLEILQSLRTSSAPFTKETLKIFERVSPLAAVCTIEMQRRLGQKPTLREALELEYRATFRSQSDGDFLEGIRAAIIDKDRNPRWRYKDANSVPPSALTAMLSPLGSDGLSFED
jgi:enoyl-CoA hydratase